MGSKPMQVPGLENDVGLVDDQNEEIDIENYTPWRKGKNINSLVRNRENEILIRNSEFKTVGFFELNHVLTWRMGKHIKNLYFLPFGETQSQEQNGLKKPSLVD